MLTYQIIRRLSAFDAKFAELDVNDSPSRPGHAKEATQELGTDFLEDLIFQAHNRQQQGIPRHAPLPMAFAPFTQLFGDAPSQPFTPKGGAYIRNLSTEDKRTRSRGSNTMMSWGSEVELPAEDAKVSPPTGARMAPPIINIQAPTESNVEKSQHGASASQAGTMRTAPRTAPVRTEIGALEEYDFEIPHGAVPDPAERDLPPPPSESIKSHRDSPVTDPTPLAQSAKSRSAATIHRGETPISLKEALGPSNPDVIPNPPLPSVPAPLPALQSTTFVNFQEPVTVVPMLTSSDVPDSQHTAYKTAFQSLPQTPPQVVSDKVAIRTTDTDPAPWDLVTQRLYSWALVWEGSTFARALEEISLGRQVRLYTCRRRVAAELKLGRGICLVYHGDDYVQTVSLPFRLRLN